MKKPIPSLKDDITPRKKRPILHLVIPTVLLAVVALFLFTQDNQAASPKQIILPPLDDATVNVLLNENMPAAVAEKKLDTWKMYDVNFSEGRYEALIWMVEIDPETGENLPAEPHLILAKYDPGTAAWSLKFSIEEDFGVAIHSSAFKDIEIAQQYPAVEPKIPKAIQTMGGYYLPWKAGPLGAWLRGRDLPDVPAQSFKTWWRRRQP